MSQRITAHIFIKLEQAIDEVAIELNRDCSDASLAGDYSQLTELLEVAKTIEAIREQVTALVEKLGTVVQPTLVTPPTITPLINVNVAPPLQVASPNNGHGPAKRLRITFQGGDVIECKNAAESFVSALEKMGFDRVAQLNKTLSGAPLVSRSEAEFTYQGKAKTGGWYICTHSNTKKKKELLEDISYRLGVQIGVELVN